AFVEGFALFHGEVANRNFGPHAGTMLLEIAEPGAVLRLGPRIHGPLLDRKRRVRNHAAHVEIDRVAEALAARASAEGRVEAEQDRLRSVELLQARLALKAFVE